MINKMELSLIKKETPRKHEENIKNFNSELAYDFLQNKYPNKIKDNVGTTLRDVLEYAHSSVVNEKSKERITEVFFVNLYSKHIRKKMAVDNAEKKGP